VPEIQIENVDDRRLADYANVSDAELLKRRGLFVAEGRLVVERLLADGRYRVRSVLLNAAAHDALAPTLAPWVDELPIYICKTSDFSPITGLNIHRGCLALAERPMEMSCEKLTAEARTLVVLEGVANADNVGGVFRNAAAFGVDAVLLSPTCCDPFYRKAIRTSMAAALGVPFARVHPWPDHLQALRDAGYQLIAFTPAVDAESLASVARSAGPARLALMFGGEGDGLTSTVQQLADVRVRIPIRPEVDSLNLAVASGIVLSWIGSLERFR